MLGVCNRLEKITGIDELVFQIIFVLWFLSNPAAFWAYLLLSVIL
jgi:phage shock protein PspC (stress-responsive transcriptional regulator)